MFTDKIIKWLLSEFNLSQSDIDKVKGILDKIDIKIVNGQTIISVRLNKISVILEGDENVY